MTSTEASYSSTARTADGTLLTIRGENVDEFKANVELLLGAGSFDSIAESFKRAYGTPGVAQAFTNIQTTFPQAQQVNTVGGVAAPLPQPGATAPVAGPIDGPPPGVPYPGNCPHGVRTFVDKPAKGRPWKRWECAIPWSPQTKDSRCKTLNA